MAMKAVGWLSSNLGWNITGKSSGAGSEEAQQQQQSSPVQQQTPPGVGVEGYLSHVSSLVFGGGSNNAQTGTAQASPFGGGSVDEVENAAVDDQGLPVTRNWYYYDNDLGRWNVSPDAPQRVKDEFAERLRLEEEEKNKASRFPDPPPPPPPTFNAAAFSTARSPLVPTYAVPTYFEKHD